jgi:hypothetical protein
VELTTALQPDWKTAGPVTTCVLMCVVLKGVTSRSALVIAMKMVPLGIGVKWLPKVPPPGTLTCAQLSLTSYGDRAELERAGHRLRLAQAVVRHALARGCEDNVRRAKNVSGKECGAPSHFRLRTKHG